MKSNATTAKETTQNPGANQVNRTQSQTAISSNPSSQGASVELKHFRRWWSDYQKKMKSAFQAVPLELQMQGEQ